jgi:thiol-disulfide isomerase/thioredoxin
MKYILILLIIAGGVYNYIKPAEPMDVLLASADSAQSSSQSGIKVLRSVGGRGFDVKTLAEPGKVTVVDFYVSWCPTCKKLNQKYQRFVKARPDVAIRRVKMIDKWSVAWAKQKYGLDITGTPHILIFDDKGNALSQDVGNEKPASQLLYKWMNAELRKG